MNYIPRVAPLRRLMREVLMSEENKPAAEAPAVSSMPAEAISAGALPVDENRRVWKSDDLLGTDTEALILHHGQTYRLRRTKQGKLILYK